MWPERGEALDRTIEVEAAVADLYAEALRRWAPTARAAVLPALTAAGGDQLPPDPAALASTQDSWDAIAGTVILTGLGLLWAVAYTEARDGLGITPPEPSPDAPNPPAVDDPDPAVVKIVTRTTDADARDVRDDYARVAATPAARDAVAQFVDAQRPLVAAFTGVVRETLAAAVHKLAVQATTTAVAIDAEQLRDRAKSVLDAAGPEMRDLARREGYQAAGVLNHAVVAAAEGSDEDLEKTWICVHPDTIVQSDEPINAARRWHSGQMVTVRTSDDSVALTVTPEHKVLTANRGWVAAQDLREGDDLIKVDWGHAVGSPDVQDEPPSIAEVFDALLKSAAPDEMGAVRSGVDFHVEYTTAGKVEVVGSDRELRHHFNPGGLYSSCEIELMLPDVARDALFSERAIGQGFGRHLTAHEGGAGLVVPRPLDIGGFTGCTQDLSLSAAASADSLLLAEDPRHGLTCASDLPANRFGGHAGQVELVQVVGVDVSAFSGHVYDLQTLGCWFAANKVVVHNCTLDGKTRKTHWAADGQRVPVGGKFSVGGEHLAFPGDPHGSAAEVKNCRCRVGVLAKDEAIPDEVDRHTERLDGRDSVAINRDGRTQAEEIRRRADEGNIRAREDPEGIGQVASGGWAAPSEQEYDMTRVIGGPTKAELSAFGPGVDSAESDAETFLTFTDALFAVTGVPTSDGRMLAGDIDLTFRDTPLPLQFCEEMEGGHYGSVTVGVVEAIRLKNGEVRADGYMLNNDNALKAIDLVSHGVCNPSIDLGNAEIICTDEGGIIITEDTYTEDTQIMWTTVKAELVATTLVAIPAFGQTRITLNAQREARDKTLVAALVASASEQFQPRVYDPAVFADPKLSGPTRLTITEDGHIFGHVACWSDRHRSVGLGHVSPPRSKNDYEHFHSSPGVHLSDGTLLPVGRLTVGIGHAPTTGTSLTAAQAHYDNVESCFALVRAGEDSIGIWVSGVAAPWATQEKIEMGLSAPLSGDWRPYNGNLELVGVLAVNTPGFLCRTGTDSRGRPAALVASLAPSQTTEAGGIDHLTRRDIKAAVREAFAEQQRAAQRLEREEAALARARAAVGDPPTREERLAALLERA